MWEWNILPNSGHKKSGGFWYWANPDTPDTITSKPEARKTVKLLTHKNILYPTRFRLNLTWSTTAKMGLDGEFMIIRGMLFVIQSWLFRSSLFLWSVIDNLIFGRAPCSQAAWPDQNQVQGDSEWAGNGINESNNDTIYILDYKYTEEDICCLASSERPTAQKPTNINAKWRPDKNTLEVSPQLVSLLWRRWALAESDGGLQGFTNINQASLTQCSGWGKTAYIVGDFCSEVLYVCLIKFLLLSR